MAALLLCALFLEVFLRATFPALHALAVFVERIQLSPETQAIAELALLSFALSFAEWKGILDLPSSDAVGGIVVNGATAT